MKIRRGTVSCTAAYTCSGAPSCVAITRQFRIANQTRRVAAKGCMRCSQLCLSGFMEHTCCTFLAIFDTISRGDVSSIKVCGGFTWMFICFFKLQIEDFNIFLDIDVEHCQRAVTKQSRDQFMFLRTLSYFSKTLVLLTSNLSVRMFVRMFRGQCKWNHVKMENWAGGKWGKSVMF